MNDAALAIPARADTRYAKRARYPTPENIFRFGWPAVPARQFLVEAAQAAAAGTPTGLIPLDTSDVLGTRYPATTPTLLLRYLKIRAGERLNTKLIASGEIHYVMSGSGVSENAGEGIEWQAGDLFCFPGGNETTHRAGATDCLLFSATNEPLLAFDRLRPPAAGQAIVETTHWLAEEIERQFVEVWKRDQTEETAGFAVQFSSNALAPSFNTIASINCAINTLGPGGDQRAHRHNGVAVTLALYGDGIHSVIDDQRVDWVTGAAQITPAASLHSHHNRGSGRMRALIFQDEALHQYTRTPGFSFE